MASALMVGAATCDVEMLARFHRSGNWQSVIAIDGGYGTLARAGVVPSIAIGDFDSLGFVPEDVATETFSPIKDQSDMELALAYARAQGLDELFIFGALGGRLDHTLANLSLFARESEVGSTVIAAGDDQALALVTGPATFHLPATDRGVVSVFAFGEPAVGVTERGLAYPLENATLTMRTSLGLSNEFIGEAATIALERGTVAIFYPIELLVGAVEP